MLNDHRCTVVGTLRKNKPEIPAVFITGRGRDKYNNLFGFQEKFILLSHVPKKNKLFLLLSSMHNDDKIDESTVDAKKPEMITCYSKTKGGVDVVDKLCASYICARNTRRWPMVIFYSILNVGGINSGIIYNENNSSKINRRAFFKSFLSSLYRSN